VRHLILGTAGHIDHGKSSLVRALTGIDPDRLKEEKERGITIDLGFADLALDDSHTLSFVDVPGHERFVRHMVAGAAGIDCVLLVIAADEGICPQTREHLAICSLLGIRHGVVVLTKAEAVDSELREVVELEVREFLRGSFLEDAPLLAVSARTGFGLDSLRAAISGLIDRVPERPSGGVARLPVDRSFTLHGFGTVVTGTLFSGTLDEGDEIEILPGGKRGRVRGLQVHRHRMPSVRSGQRTAVNLQGLERGDVSRGATVARPGTLPTTRRMWARLRLLASAPDSLKKGGVVRFHQGTCERWARFRVLGEEPQDELTVEIRLGGETVVLPGDHFVLRRPAPVDTVGGGVVVDVRPPTGRSGFRPATLTTAGDPDEDLLLRLERAGAGGREVAAFAAELGLAIAELEARARRLETLSRLVRACGLVVHRTAWSHLQSQCETMLSEFHGREPLRSGMSREELRSRLCRTIPQDLWRVFLDRLADEGRIRLHGEFVAQAGHEIRFSEEDQAIASRIEARLRDAGLDPPDPPEVLASEPEGRAARIVEVLLAERRLVRLRDGRLFLGEAVEALRGKLREHAKTARLIDVATFKQIAGVTRKNAIPLLEYLDAERTTRRLGNVREILLT